MFSLCYLFLSHFINLCVIGPSIANMFEVKKSFLKPQDPTHLPKTVNVLLLFPDLCTRHIFCFKKTKTHIFLHSIIIKKFYFIFLLKIHTPCNFTQKLLISPHTCKIFFWIHFILFLVNLSSAQKNKQ